MEWHLDFTFPKSFKELYLEMDGFYDRDMNDRIFSMMPLKRIKEEYDDSKNKDFIPFCDYLINSHQIGFSKKEKSVFIDYWPYPHKIHNDKVANTFIESLIEIINDSEKAN